jgi:hypothetical protein
MKNRITVPPVLDKLQLDLPMYSINESGKGMLSLPKVMDLLDANPESAHGWYLSNVGEQKARWHVKIGHQVREHVGNDWAFPLTDAERAELTLRRCPTISDRDLVAFATGRFGSHSNY